MFIKFKTLALGEHESDFIPTPKISTVSQDTK